MFSTRGFILELEIALSDAPAEVQPLRLIQPVAEDALKRRVT